MIYLTLDDDYTHDIQETCVETSALAALSQQKASPESDLSIVFTGNAEIQELNKTFLDSNHPTDVLSFPAGEIDPDTGHLYLGDIIISVPQAKAQAEAGAHPLQQEIEVLVVHGVLHLLGHDHAEDEEKARMWLAQKEILALCLNPLAAQF